MTETKPPHALPAPDNDFYMSHEILSDNKHALLRKVRSFMDGTVAPMINQYWADDKFPFERIPGIRDLNIVVIGFEGYGCPGASVLLDGFMSMELARVDSSIATFHGVHSGLAMGSIYPGGSEEQKQKWLPPPMARLEKDQGKLKDEHASLAKAFFTSRASWPTRKHYIPMKARAK
jgi:glutaryl-CoA dehydrogenase